MMRSSRLFNKPLIFMVFIFGVIAASTSIIFGWMLNELLTREYESKAMAIAQSMAESDMETIMAHDAGSVQTRIDQYLSIEGVSYVLVSDESGRIIAHTFTPSVPREVAELAAEAPEHGKGFGHSIQELSLEGRGDIIHTIQPVLGGMVGYVHVGMDRGIITGYISRGIITQQGLTLVIFFTCVVGAYIFMRNISRPLLELSDYAQKVAAHDFTASTDIASDDEIGILAESMRSMSLDISELITGLEKAVEDATGDLQDALNSLSAIVGNMADGLLVVDDKGEVVQFNQALADMFQLRADGLYFRQCSEVFGETISDMLDCRDEASLVKVRDREIEGVRNDGIEFPLEISVTFISLKGRCAAVAILRDITERKKAELTLMQAHDELERKVRERTTELSRANIQLKIEVAERKVVGEALKKTEEKYRTIFENAVEGIYQSTTEGRFVSVNPALARILGFESSEELKQYYTDIGAQLYVEEGRRKEFFELVMAEGEVQKFESQVRKKSGRVIWVSESVRLVRDSSGKPLFFEGSLEDVTLRKEAEKQLVHQAFHDPLTSLPNRLLFQDHLQMAMERSHRRSEYHFALLYLDLDRFKLINDSLGHDIGDELLKNVARILEQCARKVDTVSRFGGDEFAVLLEEITAPRDAIKFAKRLLKELSGTLNLRGHEVFTSASVGIVLNTADYSRPDALLRDADTAMYRAKELGNSRFKVFNKRMHEQAKQQLALETDLRRAVDRDDFHLVFQPIYALEGRELAGFETLLRWDRPGYGPLSPAEFIPVAEDSGLIYRLDQMVVERVCEHLGLWEAQFPELFAERSSFSVNVNLSGKHFRRPVLVGQVEQILKRTDIDPRRLSLEITEGALMDSPTISEEMVFKLKALGLGVCVDDFGTGYSSLSYLQRFPIDTIKIDRSFVSAIQHDSDSRAIVRTIVSLGNSLGMKVVAEGVENAEQLDFLREVGCTHAQGFFLDMPMDAARAEILMGKCCAPLSN